MRSPLPLDRMTTEEKLLALEELWENISRKPDEVPSPFWHGEILESRSRKAEEGEARFDDWDRAKDLIRDRVK